MGTRVAFRPRARSAAFEEGNGVSYLERRVKFVEGTTGTPTGDQVQVGAGTAFPLIVTVDQLLEIHYRVRDAAFTQGQITLDDFGDTKTIKADTSSRSANLLNQDGASSLADILRGYCAFSNDTTPDQPLEDISTDYFGDAYYYTAGSVNLAARDITDREDALWVGESRPAIYWDDAPVMGGPAFGQSATIKSPYRTGFNQTFENLGDAVYGSTYGVWADFNGTEVESQASINFFERVAYVDTDGSGDPFSSGNTLYAGFEFAAALGNGFGTLSGYIGTDTSFFLGTATSSGANAVVVLSEGVEISCPIYVDEGSLSAFGYIITTATDFKIAADVWWPYAHPNGDPVWDTASGEYTAPTT